ncbi:MAG: HlyC/CorC family transporter [Burkholderiales bacterium]|nr:HlyC/CorC family transporter [Burkholderiales bacterium]
MESFPLWAQFLALVGLLLLSAFFSMAETAMMAVSRLRLRHLAREGSRAAHLTQFLLDRTDRLLGVILLGNNLVNNILATLVTALAIHYFGHGDWVLAIAAGSLTFVLLVFAEITPKVIGATHPERVALPASFVLALLLKLSTPLVWFVNLFVGTVLRILRVRQRSSADATRLTPQELRTIVLEGGSFIPSKHRSILLNLFDLEQLTVDDVMTPRARIEGLDVSEPPEAIGRQLTTCYHNKLPVFDGDIARVIGILHVRKLLPLLGAAALTAEQIRDRLVPPYYIPTGTPLLQQLQLFQDNRQRVGLVVDEYGDVRGLVTLEDIVEEIVGEFTTQAPGSSTAAVQWAADGQVVVDGSISLRALNRRLHLHFPLDGPRTLNGLLLEQLEEIPEAPCCIRYSDCIAEIIQTDEHAVRNVRLVSTGAAGAGLRGTD